MSAPSGRPGDEIIALRDYLGRVVRIREALAEGDAYFAEEIASGVEVDLDARVRRLEEAA